jgi:hypothetical protein
MIVRMMRAKAVHSFVSFRAWLYASFAVASCVSQGFALQEATAHIEPPTVVSPELTETDITTVKDFRAVHAQILGVSLGMTMQQAVQILSAHKGLLIERDENNPTRLYVYDRAPDGTKAGDSILYYIWEPSDPRLLEITVFQGFAKYLHGHTKDLLTLAALDSASPISRSFLGEPSHSRVTFNMPEIKSRDTTYSWNAKGIDVIDRRLGDDRSVVFALVLAERFPGERWLRATLKASGTYIIWAVAGLAGLAAFVALARFSRRAKNPTLATGRTRGWGSGGGSVPSAGGFDSNMGGRWGNSSRPGVDYPSSWHGPNEPGGSQDI